MTLPVFLSALQQLWRSARLLWIALILAAIGATGWIMPGIPALAVAVALVYAARKMYMEDVGEYGGLTAGLGLTAGALWMVWCSAGLLTGALPPDALPNLPWKHSPAPVIDTVLATAGLTAVMVSLGLGGAMLLLASLSTMAKKMAAFAAKLRLQRHRPHPHPPS